MAPKNKPQLVGRETRESIDEAQHSLSMEEQEEAVREAGGTVEEPAEPAEKEKPKTKAKEKPDTPDTPQYVRNGLMMANFVRPHFGAEKDKKFIEMEMSMELTQEHEKVLPEPIKRAWEFVGDEESKSVSGIPLEYQAVEVHLVPDGREADLVFNPCAVTKNAITVLEEKGTGEATTIVRWSFRLRLEHDSDRQTIRFAVEKYAGPVWLKIEPIQRRLRDAKSNK